MARYCIRQRLYGVMRLAIFLILLTILSDSMNKMLQLHVHVCAYIQTAEICVYTALLLLMHPTRYKCQL